MRQWHEHSLVGDVLLKIDVENTSREQVKVEIGVAPADDEVSPNCELPLTGYFTQIYANGLTARPVVALIHKTDPSKPFGQLKLTVGAKRLRAQFSSIGRSTGTGGMGIGMGTGTGGSSGYDPTYT